GPAYGGRGFPAARLGGPPCGRTARPFLVRAGGGQTRPAASDSARPVSRSPFGSCRRPTTAVGESPTSVRTPGYPAPLGSAPLQAAVAVARNPTVQSSVYSLRPRDINPSRPHHARNTRPPPRRHPRIARIRRTPERPVLAPGAGPEPGGPAAAH